MEWKGATWIKIRPGAEPVNEEEELDRTIPVIEALRRKGLRIPISIDTYKASVAERALAAGAEIVNDISGLHYDPRLAAVVASHRAALVLMHMRGTPGTMQRLPALKQLIPSIRKGLSSSLRRAMRAGIRKTRIVLDPGIGFGKSGDQNFEILRSLPRLGSLGYPILVGPSRKSFISRALDSLPGKQPASRILAAKGNRVERTPEELLFGTAAAVAAAILNGAHIVRVHDVRQMVAVARIADLLLGCRESD